MSDDLPTGTVTFLFTDIEGSTRLLQALGNDYADALARHRRTLRDVFTRHSGFEVDTQGDAFFIAFARANDALTAAQEGQRALAGAPIRVRMGLHTGEPLLTEGGYVGIDVHRAARIAAIGHGGQILVSQSTRALVSTDDVYDLGQHRLKDLTAPERIYQLGHEEFPPLRSLNRTSLPIAAFPLVGRAREVGELRNLLSDGGRLVTITGAGGSGKTRLALQVAAELVDDIRDGVFFVSLASVAESALVATTIAQAAEVRDIEELRESAALLVLDNFEHLLAAVGEVSTLLSRAPRVKLLVTSRVRLRISGEREYALDPLPQDQAVEFFLERAAAVKRDIRLDAVIPEICKRLDGLPLALELAASRLKVLDPPLLLERLGQRLTLLTGGARDAPERQQTLRATIEWSYGLLEASLQQRFRRLSAFAGSFSLEAAEAVTEAGLDEVSGLVDWSLVKPIGEGRFLMLETIREYAQTMLAQNNEVDEIRERHLGFFLDLVELAEPNLTGPEQRQWYDRLALEKDNIREALGYACDSDDAERALMLSGTMWRFWLTHGHISEALHWYKRATTMGRDASAAARARAMYGQGEMAEARGESARARSFYEEAAELFRGTDEKRWLILALAHAGNSVLLEDPPRAEALYVEALALAREIGDQRNHAMVTTNLGFLRMVEGDDDRAAPLFEESLERARAIGDVAMVAVDLQNLAILAFRRADVETAAARLSESLQLSSTIGHVRTLVHALSFAAAVAFARGGRDASARLCAATEALCKEHAFILDTVENRLLADTVGRLRAALGHDFEDAWSIGAQLELPAAVELALSSLQ